VLRIKTNSARGGVVEHVYLRNIQVGQVAHAAVLVDFFYEEGDSGKFDPVVRNIEVRRLTCKKARHVLYLRGYARAPITDIRLEDCVFENIEKPDVIEHVQGLVRRRVEVNGRRT
jgi:hypothetical protein